MMGIGIAQQATVNIVQNQIVNNLGWGVSLWTKACERQAAEESFTGKITGKSNEIPGLGESQENQRGDVCPAALRFLKTNQGGQYP